MKANTTARISVCLALAAALGASGCASRYVAADDELPAEPLDPAVIAATDWHSPAYARIGMADFAFAPRQAVFVQGQPIRLELINIGFVTHVFAAPGFFRAVAIHSVVSGPSRAPIRAAG